MNKQQKGHIETTNFNLEKARKRVTEVTNQIVNLFCDRQKLMRKIAEAKNKSDDVNIPIFLPQREQEILSHFHKIAKIKNVDPDMMDMLISMLMSAAKFTQMDILKRQTVLDTKRIDKDLLKDNLLVLTENVATTYDLYDKQAEGTHIECVRELQLLKELTELYKEGTAVNLGSANGDHVTNTIKQGFQRIIGYDISPKMIECAKIKYPNHEFYIHDLDNGIPLENSSVSLVIANFGAASEVCINLWQETSRVLRSDGRAYFSFYNKDALVTQWWTPWSNSFRITINPHNDTIMVPLLGGDGSAQIFWIHGKSITEDEIRANAHSSGLEICRIESSSPLWDDKPPEFFKHACAVEAAIGYETTHAHIPPFLGQYLRVVVKKNEK